MQQILGNKIFRNAEALSFTHSVTPSTSVTGLTGVRYHFIQRPQNTLTGDRHSFNSTVSALMKYFTTSQHIFMMFIPDLVTKKYFC